MLVAPHDGQPASGVAATACIHEDFRHHQHWRLAPCRNPALRVVCIWPGASWLMASRCAGLPSVSMSQRRRRHAGPAAIGSSARPAWRTAAASADLPAEDLSPHRATLAGAAGEQAVGSGKDRPPPASERLHGAPHANSFPLPATAVYGPHRREEYPRSELPHPKRIRQAGLDHPCGHQEAPPHS